MPFQYQTDLCDIITVKNLLCSFEILYESVVLWHLPYVLPIFILRKSHHIEYPIQLFLVIGVASLDVFLPTVENWF